MIHSWYNLCSDITITHKHTGLRWKTIVLDLWNWKWCSIHFNILFGLAYSDETKSTCWTHPGSGYPIQSGHFSWPGKKKNPSLLLPCIHYNKSWHLLLCSFPYLFIIKHFLTCFTLVSYRWVALPIPFPQPSMGDWRTKMKLQLEKSCCWLMLWMRTAFKIISKTHVWMSSWIDQYYFGGC